MMKINEIFFSIQGESSYVGHPTVFIRTSGCHLRCTYCDTTYAYYEGKKLTRAQILETVRSYPAHYVCLTGGEPLLQAESLSLMRELCDAGYHVSLETSGDLSCRDVDARVLKVIDIKTPDSGAAHRFDFDNLVFDQNATARKVNTEFKFVICSEQDFAWAQAFAREHNLFGNFCVLFSPSFRVIGENWLAKKILENGSQARLQLQLHKYIWKPDQRGV